MGGPEEVKANKDTWEDWGALALANSSQAAIAWLPIIKAGYWQDTYPGKGVPWPSEETLELATIADNGSCAVFELTSQNGPWMPYNCTAIDRNYFDFLCSCSVQERPYLTLRGLCDFKQRN